MADLAKYGEVQGLTNGAASYINEKLKEGWDLITVKIVEVQFRVSAYGGESSYMQKRAETHYVIGKPREKAKIKTS